MKVMKFNIYKLKKQIEERKVKLKQIIEENSFLINEDVLEVSRDIDGLIAYYYYLEKNRDKIMHSNIKMVGKILNNLHHDNLINMKKRVPPINIVKREDDEFEYPITHLFQPICDIETKDIIGHEALLRDAVREDVSPTEIFDYAKERSCQSVLDLISIKNAVYAYKSNMKYIFINIFPSTLLREDFLFWWNMYVPSDIPVVLEILKREQIQSWNETKNIIVELRKKGVKISIDDMNINYASMKGWLDLDPDFVKLDCFYSRNLAEDIRKQELLKCIVDIFGEKTQIIIEGIENPKDLEIASSLGIHCAQGYFLGKPMAI